MWIFYTPITFLASCIWNLSEWSGISLGDFGVKIFNLMMQQKGVSMKEVKHWGTTNVKLTEYYKKDKWLVVEYTNDKRYLYSDVPLTIWQSLVDAKSIGSYLHLNIKGNFSYVDITGVTL